MKSILAISIFSALSAVAVATDYSEEDLKIIDRLGKSGSVCLEGDDTWGSSAPVIVEVRSGKDIVAASCNACHGTGLLGAPKVGSADWGPRMDERGIEGLLTHALEGFNSMPAKGNCATCSDDEILTAIEYMINPEG